MLLIFAFFWQQKFAILFSKCKGEGDSEGESLLVWGKRFSFFLQTYSLLNVGGKGVIFDPKICIAFFFLIFFTQNTSDLIRTGSPYSFHLTFWGLEERGSSLNSGIMAVWRGIV